jgi:hypothetical protein
MRGRKEEQLHECDEKFTRVHHLPWKRPEVSRCMR